MIVEALLLSLVAYFGYCSNKFFGDSMLNRPLVTATLTGLVLGDLQMGLVMAGNVGTDMDGCYVSGLIYAVRCYSGQQLSERRLLF